MVKHAASEEEPILTAEDRVAKVLKRLRQKHDFYDAQLMWLGLIHAHLVENLSIGPDDFDLLPVFQRAGGLSRARQVFKTDFIPLLTQINTAIAAYGAHQ